MNTTKFGAFVTILPGRDGLIHISQLSGLTPDGQHVNKVAEVLQLGQALDVRVEEIDPNGKISLGLAEAQSAEERDAPSLPASETPGSESRR